MKNHVIYKITNSVNGKVYIGQTTQGLARRKGEHLYRFRRGERKHRLYLAMSEHGEKAFKFEMLFCVTKSDHLDELEIDFIKEYDSYNHGYNMRCGDDICSETRENLSQALKGRKITWYDKIVASRKANGSYENIARHDIGAKSKLSKYYLIEYPNGEQKIIKGIHQFCKENNLTDKCMYDVMNGKQRHHKGFKLLAKFNDYPAREYSQAVGNGTHPNQ